MVVDSGRSPSLIDLRSRRPNCVWYHKTRTEPRIRGSVFFKHPETLTSPPMPRSRRRQSLSVHGRDPRFKGNMIVAAVVVVVLVAGVFLLVKAMSFGDEPVRSAVN